MADPGAGGGGGLTKKLGPLPVWLWAVGAGGLLGGIWFLRSKNSAAAQPANAADATAGGDDSRTTIVPSVDAGLSQNQWQYLVTLLQGLYGPGSTPPPDTTPPTGTKNPGIPVQTPGGSITVHPPVPPPTTGGSNTGSTAGVHPLFITVPQGSGWSWSSIAAQYGHSWQDLWAYNLTPGVRPAATEAQLKSEGVNHSLFGGTKVAVPSNWKKVS